MAEREASSNTRWAFWLIVVVVVGGGVIFALTHHGSGASTAQLDESGVSADTGAAPAQGVTVSPLLLAGRSQTITVDKGERVVIRARSDRAAVLHLHGYNRRTPLTPGKIGRIELDPEYDGEFAIEFHYGGTNYEQVGTLRVNP